MKEQRKPLLLYIHGFNSSPQSHKAQVMQDYCQTNRPDITVLTPTIPSYPLQAAEFIHDLVHQYKNTHHIGLVGSSLGGYLSIWLNNQFGLRAVLINPAIRPYELLSNYLGEQVNPYTKERYILEEKHIEELKSLDIEMINHPHDFWLLQQMGDELLDYRQAVDKLMGAKQTIEIGGEHSFVDFERYPEKIITFLQL